MKIVAAILAVAVMCITGFAQDIGTESIFPLGVQTGSTTVANPTVIGPDEDGHIFGATLVSGEFSAVFSVDVTADVSGADIFVISVDDPDNIVELGCPSNLWYGITFIVGLCLGLLF